MSQRFEQLNQGGGSEAPSRQPGGFSPGASPSADERALLEEKQRAQLSQAQRRIRDAPAIASVKQYDADWQFVVINGGQRRNLEPGRELAVRRGHEILGLVRLDEVLEEESIGELVGAWRRDKNLAKPEAGDDVITYPLF